MKTDRISFDNIDSMSNAMNHDEAGIVFVGKLGWTTGVIIDWLRNRLVSTDNPSDTRNAFIWSKETYWAT